MALVVAVADTPDLRRRGLRAVADLGDLDGMLFVFSSPGPVSFTMQDTLIPLDLLVFSEGGVMVDRIEMTPCSSEPCPLYPAGEAVELAVEVAAGTFPDLLPGAAIDVKGPA